MKINILITGASSGLGRELALRYDLQENRLFLLARREDKLKETQSLFKNATVEIYVVDVGDYKAIDTLINSILHENRLDLVVANAGISVGHHNGITPIDDFVRVININLISIHNLLIPIIDAMRKQKSGKIVLISSMASYVTMPSSIAYSVSKRALSAYAEGLRNQLIKDNIKIINIKPGFIESEITAKNDFKMPFFMKTQKGVDRIYNAIEKNIYEYAFPFRFFIIVKTISLMPRVIKDYFIQKAHFKK